MAPWRRTEDVVSAGRLAEPEDCMECKLIGSGAMFGLSGYFGYLARGAQFAGTTAGLRSFNAAMSVAFAAAGLARFFAEDIRKVLTESRGPAREDV